MIKELSNLCNYYGINGKIVIYRPYCSKKRLLARWIINQALKNGELKAGQNVAEITAGNFGIALAEQCQNLNCNLYLVPIGKFDEKVSRKLLTFDNVRIAAVKNSRDMTFLKQTLEEVIEYTHAYSFRQFDNKKQISFYKDLLKAELKEVKPDAVFEKVGTGATMQAVKELLTEQGLHEVQYFIVKPDTRPIETSHLLLSPDNVFQTHPNDITEYVCNFETVLQEQENLTNIPYAKLSLFCALEWLKQNPKKTAFVFIGD